MESLGLTQASWDGLPWPCEPTLEARAEGERGSLETPEAAAKAGVVQGAAPGVPRAADRPAI